MRITRARIENFGPHEKIDEHTDVGVVGLVGPNGTGKSSVFEALQIALQGRPGLPSQTLDSYIRTGPGNPKSANLTFDFRKDGIEGRIHRKITRNGSTRKLEWNGETYTKAGEVQAAINDILAVDEYVLQNAVFPKQGDLIKLLFGTDKEREEMFVKIMLLGYMSKTADVAERKSQTLKQSVTDTTILRDELEGQQRTIEVELARLEGQLKKLPSQSATIKQVQRALNDFESLERSRADFIAAKTRRNHAKEILDKRYSEARAAIVVMGLSDPGLRRDLSKVGQSVKAMRTHAEKASKTFQAQTDALRLRDKINYLDDRYASLTARLGEIEASGVDLNAASIKTQISKISDNLKLAEKTEREWEAWSSNKIDLVTTEKALKEAEKQITKLNPAYQLAQRKLQTASDHHKLQTAIISRLAEMANSKETECVCPVCRTQLSSRQEIVDLYNSAREDSASIYDDYDQVKEEVEDLCKRMDNLKTKRDICLAAHGAALEATTEEPEGDWDTSKRSVIKLQETLAELHEAHTRAISMSAAVERVQKELLDLNKDRLAISKADRDLAASFDKEEYEASRDLLESHSEDVERIQNIYNDLIAFDSAHTEAENEVSRLDELLHDKSTTLDSSIEMFSSDVMSIYNDECEAACDTPISKEDRLRYTLKRLEDLQDAHSQLKGAVDEAKKNAGNITARICDLDAQDKSNDKVRVVAEELSTVKEAFSRTGIPRAYVAYHYEMLVMEAEKYLEHMGTDFTISVDIDKPVSLNFISTSKESGILPQAKLSGGQKVRVSVAFLLAVQKLLVPELGFLILDEPSTHVHSEAVQDLADLISLVGKQFGKSESQIWVSDHHEGILTALDKVIRMS